MATVTVNYTEADSFIPRAFPSENCNSDKTYIDLQQKMIDNGWEPHESDGTVTFVHVKYGKRQFPCHVHITRTGEKLMFPMSDLEDDPNGLACHISTTYGTGTSEIVSNEWVSYWDTRTGKRREKYLLYLSRRQKKRQQIEEENAKAAKNNKPLGL